MNNKVVVSKDIIFYAFRYVLGRRTYAPLVLKEAIKENIFKFDDWELKKMYDEIMYQDNNRLTNNVHYNPFGDNINFKIWMEIKNVIIEEMERRNLR